MRFSLSLPILALSFFAADVAANPHGNHSRRPPSPMTPLPVVLLETSPFTTINVSATPSSPSTMSDCKELAYIRFSRPLIPIVTEALAVNEQRRERLYCRFEHSRAYLLWSPMRVLWPDLDYLAIRWRIPRSQLLQADQHLFRRKDHHRHHPGPVPWMPLRWSRLFSWPLQVLRPRVCWYHLR
jgi:hypothetical protein